MKQFAESFYKSQQWQKCRAEYYKYRGGLCERCLENGLIRPGEIVHHKIHLTPENISDPHITLSFQNLQLLCREHHAEEHGARERRYNIDQYGRVSPK